MNSALSGIQAGTLLHGASAATIARGPVPGNDDLVDAMAGLITAGVMYDANATVLRHLAEHERAIVDILA